MNSKERLNETLNHREPDQVVVDFGSSFTTGIHVETIEKLRNYYGLPQNPVRVVDPYQMLGEVDSELIDIIGIDVVPAWGMDNIFGFYNHSPFKSFKTFWGQEVLVPENFNTTFEENGDLLMYAGGDLSFPPSAKMPKASYFFDAIIRQKPFDEDNLNVEDNLEEFALVSSEELEFQKNSIANLIMNGKGIFANFGGVDLGDVALIPGMSLKNPKGIRDISEWYLSTLMRPEFVKNIFERQVETGIENLQRIYSAVGNNIDVIAVCGADFGTQSSTFCSVEQFQEMWFPYYRKINDWIHQNTTWKTFKHSCGAVEGFMRSFIEAGFDIINPVQINALGMDPQHLKSTYGKEMVFWGGGVDTQNVLPYGTPNQIREQVLRTCDIFSKDGGFVFNTVHNLQARIPIENVIAMINAIKEFNGQR